MVVNGVKRLRVAVIGAGDRGNIYADYALLHPEQMEIVSVAEPDPTRRVNFAKKFHLEPHFTFSTYQELFFWPQICDAVFITTQDHLHVEPTILALQKGYHVLVEKPLSPSIQDGYRMIHTALATNRWLQICYVLRFTPFFQKIKEIIDSGEIGNIRHISLDMNVAYWHQAHSYVRGNWRSEETSSPMLLAKCCHDLDILQHLINQKCIQVSSYGHLSHFRIEHAPVGSTERCLDGCLVEKDCPYSARKLYLGEQTGWPISTISSDLSLTGREKALQEGPYGRCVYRCDNDVVDHQIVNLLYEGQATATLTMSAFTDELSRTIRILGTKGELEGKFHQSELTLRRFGKENETILVQPSSFGQHMGGDYGLMKAFVETCRERESGFDQTIDLMASHILAYAAEESRLRGINVNIKDFTRTLPITDPIFPCIKDPLSV